MQHDIVVPSWVDRGLYPFTPRTFTTREGRMAYLDEGRRDAPVVLLVHGTPTWSFEHREVIRLLAPHRRVIAPDHLGFGLSDKPEDAAILTPAAHARRLRALVEHLDLRDVTLVVHDFGGPIGLPLALEGDRVARVVLMNTWMWSIADDPGVARIRSLIEGPIGRFLYFTLNVSPRTLLPSVLGDRSLLTPHLHAHYLAPFAERSARTSLYALARALGGAGDYYGSLWETRSPLADKPLSIVWGMKDPAFQASHLARWTETFPHASVTRLPEVGHFPAEEEPASVAAAIIGPALVTERARAPRRERAPVSIAPRLVLAAAGLGLAAAAVWTLWP
ncbi:MAG: alpha/beta fold hydrolase [Deltaproteobacteria bacterium]|nr:alpha/beta fold hydrolase [Deltaproteobacteria bacterium]